MPDPPCKLCRSVPLPLPGAEAPRRRPWHGSCGGGRPPGGPARCRGASGGHASDTKRQDEGMRYTPHDVGSTKQPSDRASPGGGGACGVHAFLTQASTSSRLSGSGSFRTSSTFGSCAHAVYTQKKYRLRAPRLRGLPSGPTRRRGSASGIPQGARVGRGSGTRAADGEVARGRARPPSSTVMRVHPVAPTAQMRCREGSIDRLSSRLSSTSCSMASCCSRSPLPSRRAPCSSTTYNPWCSSRERTTTPREA